MTSDPETKLACAADLLNMWAREVGVSECTDPFGDLALRDTINRVWCRVSDQQNRLRRDKERLSKELQKQMHDAQSAAHVIIEAGVVPGEFCRCEECCDVARRMDDAGFLERVSEKWWREEDHACNV